MLTSSWKGLELIFLTLYALAFYAIVIHRSVQLSHGNFIPLFYFILFFAYFIISCCPQFSSFFYLSFFFSSLIRSLQKSLWFAAGVDIEPLECMFFILFQWRMHFFFYLHLFNFSWKYFSCMCWFSLGITLSAFSILAAAFRSISAGWKLQHYKDALVRCLVHAICLRIVSYTDTYAEWPFYLIFGFWFFHSLSKIWAMILKLLFLFYFF